ncbi:MAG: hypothetical protein HY332_15620 [Chloroflexi bacterium]|nr:hypothetical protein [Chloroflexota bacterium]
MAPPTIARTARAQAAPTSWVTRAAVLRASASTLAVGVLAACTGPFGAEAPKASAQPASLILHTDWLSGPRGQVTEQALAEFGKRHPNIKVTTEALPGDTAEKLTALIAADSIGDVALWTHHLVVYFAKPL